ncbi:MAG: response regulator [Gemmatimonadaceae bacterium]|nr:response regulator [Gemmatimonadaceae bacterium]
MTEAQLLNRQQVRRLYRAALFAVLFIAFIAAAGGIGLEASARWVQHTREVLRTVRELQAALLSSESQALLAVSSARPLAAPRDVTAPPPSLDTGATTPLLDRLTTLTRDNSLQQARAQRLTEAVAAWEDELIAVTTGRVTTPSITVNVGLRAALDEFQAEESELYSSRIARQQQWRAALIIALLFSLTLVAFALRYVMRGALGEARRRIASEAERDRASRLLEFALESSPLAVGVVNTDGALVLENDTWRRLSEQAEAPILPLLQPQIDAVRASGNPQVAELTVHALVDGKRAPDGPIADEGKSVRTLAVSAYAVGKAQPLQVGLVLFDLTDQRWLETQLRHAQRMEALGRLAGGVAHDINNVLTAIIGFTEMAIMGAQRGATSGNTQLQMDLQQVRRAADRAAMMARQLLTFSRQNVLRVRAINPADVLLDLEPMLRRIMGSHVQFAVRASSDTWSILADPGQIEQVVLNLAINARDAMDTGGELTVELSNIPARDVLRQSGSPAWPGDRPPVDCVRITVVDTGGGIPESVRARIFDPFFTTKAAGKGTGLGLATVRQIVSDLNGHIALLSEIGQGTTFSVMLPRVAAAPEPVRPVAADPVQQIRRGSVLVAEDDRDVRFLTEYVLGEAGFTVHTVRNGRDAINAIERSPVPFDILITDLVMPDIGGIALGEHPTVKSRGIVVMYMSGYPADTYGQQTTVPADAHFLAKPFTPSALLEAMAEVLSKNGSDHSV